MRQLTIVIISLLLTYDVTAQCITRNGNCIGDHAVGFGEQVSYSASEDVFAPSWSAVNGIINGSGQNISVTWSITQVSGVLILNSGGQPIVQIMVGIGPPTPLPLPPTVANQERCGMGTVTFTASPGPGETTNITSYRWYLPDGNFSGFTGPNYTTNVFDYTGDGATYSVSAVNSKGQGPRAYVEAIIKFPPHIVAQNNTPAICSGQSTNIALTTTNGVNDVTFNWNVSADGVAGAVAGSGATITQNLSHSGAADKNVTYTITPLAAGCQGGLIQASVTVKPTPVALASNQEICSGQTTNIAIANTNAVPNTAFTWSVNAPNLSGAASGSGSTITQTLTNSTQSAQQATYTILPFSNNGCNGPVYNVVITVVPKLSVSTPGPCADALQINYIIANTILQKGITDANAVQTMPIGQIGQSITYFDGLSRPIQTVVTKGSYGRKDIVQPVIYDDQGRTTRAYLPFTDEANGYYKPKNTIFDQSGNYIGNAQTFYATGSDNAIADDVRPFTENIIEPSPLNRTLRQHGPGKVWHDAGKYIEQGYAINIYNTSSPRHERIIAWTIGESGLPERSSPLATYVEPGGYYAIGQLYVHSTKDENGAEVREYSDKQGRTILKKVMAVSGAALTAEGQWAQTYYVYDSRGNLAYVFPPELTKSINQNNSYNPTVTDLNTWAFQYKYDGRKRMVEKCTPGIEPVFMVYDDRDRLVMTQDGAQRAKPAKEWTFIKYDVLNRQVLTGVYKTEAGASAIQDAINTHYSSAPRFDTYVGSSTGNLHGYNDASFPTNVPEADFFTATYYDVYDDFIAPPSTAGTPGYRPLNQGLTGEVTAALNSKTGQVTGVRIKNLATGQWMRTVNYFDEQYRLIQSVGDHQKGTIRISNVYDFTGKVLRTKRKYLVSNIETSIIENFVYDHGGRLLETRHIVNGYPEVVVSKNEYNELGQLITKKLHKTSSGIPVTADPAVGQPGVVYAQEINSSAYNSAEHTYIAAKKVLLQKGFKVQVTNPFKARIGFSEQDAITHNNAITTAFLQSVDYRYNIRGWLDLINNPVTPQVEDLFNMAMQYHNPASGVAAQYNGNISEALWTTAGQDKQSYGYSYDAMNRLTDANYHNDEVPTASGKYDEKIEEYDFNGNIKNLMRRGNTNLPDFAMDNLTYHYADGGNKLTGVSDTEPTQPGETGFKEVTPGNADYTYDNNGNMKADANKAITAIEYNHLNLPSRVSKSSTEYITYDYDATGRKLTQQVFGTAAKRTDYVGELVYQNDTLKFINHAEGRVIMTGNSPEYQYHLKDYLGNVRLTFTAAPETEIFTATSELSSQASEANTFNNYNPVDRDLYDHTDPGTQYRFVQLLTGGHNSQVALAKSLSVMPGDTLKAEVYAKYQQPSTTNSGLAAFATALTAAFGLNAPAPGDPGIAYDALHDYGSLIAGGYDHSHDQSAPKAYLNILLFDRDYNFVDAAYSQIDVNNIQVDATKTPHGLPMDIEKIVTTPGYAYIFVSNENLKEVGVYFDDLKLTHSKSRVVQMDDYYPFGLTFNSHHKENAIGQKYLYNGKERQDELGINWLDYGARMYMPDLGRWGTSDILTENSTNLTPYRYGFNNPVRFLDPNGMYETDGHYWTVYLMATLMGSTQARAIAYSAEYPDNLLSSQGDIMSERWTWADPFWHQPVVHALTGRNANLERDLSATMASLSANVGELGIALHRLGDSFAHTFTNDGSGITHSGPLGHLFWGHWPDKIANRPELYLKYVNSLAATISSKFGYQGTVDLFTFEYISKLKGTTEQNSAVFETEVRIQEKQKVFSVSGDHVNAIKDYLSERKDQGRGSIKSTVSFVPVTIFTRDKNGEWQSRTETRTLINWDNE